MEHQHTWGEERPGHRWLLSKRCCCLAVVLYKNQHGILSGLPRSLCPWRCWLLPRGSSGDTFLVEVHDMINHLSVSI